MLVIRDEAIGLLLHRQGLTRPGWESERPRTVDDVVATIERMGILQIDTIHVVARSPYIVLWSRLGAFPPDLLERALADRRIYEYWSHEASFLPIGHLPYSRLQMLGEQTRHKWVHATRERHPEAFAAVEALLAERPEVRSSDFAREVPGSGRGWWDWKPEKRALEAMFILGELTVARRERFQRIYTRLGSHYSHLDDARLPGADEAADEHVRRAAQGLGVATIPWLADYFRRPIAETKAAVDRLVAAGELVAVEIAGVGVAYADARAVQELERVRAGELRPSGTVLLSPFDPVVWDRKRGLALFDFDYRLESYTPEAKRIYGYFTLPILHDGKLVGRLDAKAFRAEQRLEVRNVHLEPNVPVEGVLLSGLADALDHFATWQRLDQVEVLRSTPIGLRRRLNAALKVVRASRRAAERHRTKSAS